MSLTGFNLRRKHLAEAEKEPVISTVTETEQKVEEVKAEPPKEKPVTEKVVHKKTTKK